jgi:5-methylcytosine-specific restriction enzyme subunit McrC
MGPTAGLRASYQLKYWAGNAAQDGVARIRVATLDLSDLNTVPRQLSAIFHSEKSEAVAMTD